MSGKYVRSENQYSHPRACRRFMMQPTPEPLTVKLERKKKDQRTSVRCFLIDYALFHPGDCQILLTRRSTPMELVVALDISSFGPDPSCPALLRPRPVAYCVPGSAPLSHCRRSASLTMAHRRGWSIGHSMPVGRGVPGLLILEPHAARRCSQGN